ncbi:MAG TPA: MBL fold metallo-hydrolase [Treponema sp.]|nr:MBL fold metallo-hydrolase [Treponema sp.]
MKIYFHYSVEGFSNGYLVGNEKTREAVMIDPGLMNQELLSHIEKNKYHLTSVLITHNHESHHSGLETLLRVFNPKVYAADAELKGIKTMILQGDGTFLAAGFPIRYFATPGHSPDSLMYQIKNVIFPGDALSAGRLGTTNNIYGRRNLVAHLRNKLLTQNDDIIVMPGHGPPSTIGAERLFNYELMQNEPDSTESVRHVVVGSSINPSY